ncbi:thiamine pyrophosphate-binding protein [Novosphingobium sp.]|uniref:thiamine pyrophosphate-binding protein n=1 Tax=Novosphingobium sp. TaxID=1874826 RepID=UPI002B45F33A|nr:thiamine pyrophosphate-binding protein [Novosphingobium sp.]HKR92257.1 thiamine pyrophosphate-binding protein [Novosphingobium sp.]
MTISGLKEAAVAQGRTQPSPAARYDGGAAVVDVLKAAGVETIFLLHGGHIDPIILAAENEGIRLIDTRHEAVTGYAADATTRMTGKLGVSLTTAGPGFTNVITAITSAWLDRIPVLFIAGAPPLRDIETNVLQGGIDQVAMAGPVTKWAGRATSAETAMRLTAHAIRTAQSGVPGPVYLELPIDILFGDAQDIKDKVPEIQRAAPPAPDADAIKQAIAILAKAERPVIMAGTGVVLSRAGELLGQFAQAAGIPVFTNVKAAGVLGRGHPNACGTFADITRASLAPDAALLIGARIGMYTGGANGVIPAAAKLIQIDIDEREMGRERNADVGIVADCKATAEALLSATATTRWPDRSSFLAEARQARGWIAERFGNLSEKVGSPVHPWQAVHRLRDVIRDDVLVISDGGDTSGWCEIGLSDLAGEPGSYASVGYLGNLGMHQGWALAAQLAFPRKRVVCVTGDGSIGFQAMEFDTYVRHNLPIVTVVLNNSAWGMSISGQHVMWKGRDIAARLNTATRYDLIAEACGGHGELVTDPVELMPAYERALASGRPACVNVVMETNAQVMSPRTEAMITAITGEVIMPYYANLKE